MVLRQIEKILVNRPVRSRLEVARKSDIQKYIAHMDRAAKRIDLPDEKKIIINEKLIGGYALEHNSYRIDNTYRSRLIGLYRSII